MDGEDCNQRCDVAPKAFDMLETAVLYSWWFIESKQHTTFTISNQVNYLTSIIRFSAAQTSVVELKFLFLASHFRSTISQRGLFCTTSPKQSCLWEIEKPCVGCDFTSWNVIYFPVRSEEQQDEHDKMCGARHALSFICHVICRAIFFQDSDHTPKHRKYWIVPLKITFLRIQNSCCWV